MMDRIRRMIVIIRNNNDKRNEEERKALDLWCFIWTINHDDMMEDDTWNGAREEDASECRLISIFRRLRLDIKWLKEDRTGGRKEREVESEKKVTGEARNIRTKGFNRNVFSSITTAFSLTYICLFKRERRCGSEGMRRDGYTRIRSAISRYFPPSVRGFVDGRWCVLNPVDEDDRESISVRTWDGWPGHVKTHLLWGRSRLSLFSCVGRYRWTRSWS